MPHTKTYKQMACYVSLLIDQAILENRVSYLVRLWCHQCCSKPRFEQISTSLARHYTLRNSTDPIAEVLMPDPTSG